MNQINAVATCVPCRELSLGTGRIEPHGSMLLQDAQPLQGLDGSIERQYRCADCGTIWLRRTDKWGVDAGFRLLP